MQVLENQAEMLFETRFILGIIGLIFVLIILPVAMKDRQTFLSISYTIALVGGLSNAAVVFANGFKMPVRLYAGSNPIYPEDLDRAHIPMSDKTHLNILGDVIPWRFGEHGGMCSIGDILIYGGIGLAIPAP